MDGHHQGIHNNQFIQYTYRANLIFILIGTDHILGGWWCKTEVTQALGVRYVYRETPKDH